MDIIYYLVCIVWLLNSFDPFHLSLQGQMVRKLRKQIQGFVVSCDDSAIMEN